MFEVAFPAEERWETWRALAGTRAALDSPRSGQRTGGLPGPQRIVGCAGATWPKVSPGAAAVELPEPEEAEVDLRSADRPVYPAMSAR